MNFKYSMFLLLVVFGLTFADCVYIAHDCRTQCCGQQGGMYMLDSINDMSQALALENQGRAIIFNKGTQPGGEDICMAYADSSNLNSNTMYGCINNCQANAGCGVGSSPPATVTEPVCDNEMGKVISVSGNAYYARAGKKQTVIVGQPYCEGDVIITESDVGNNVVIQFNDGNVRYIMRSSTYSLVEYEPKNYYEGISGAVQAFSKDRVHYDSDTIVGAITAPRAGFKIHSNVLFEIDSSTTRVTVLEGSVDVYDLNTGNVVGLINAEEQYQANSNADPATGTVYEIDLADYSVELARSDEIDSYSSDGTRGVQYLNEIMELVMQGFEEAMDKGALAQEKVVGVKVKILDGTIHEDAVHRGPSQILPATRNPIYAGMIHAGIVLKEPKQKLLIQVPHDFSGDVITLLNGKRGQLSGMDQEDEISTVKFKVPVAEMFGFSSELRSATQGKAIWYQEYAGYEPLQRELQKTVVRKIRERKGIKPEPPEAKDFVG